MDETRDNKQATCQSRDPVPAVTHPRLPGERLMEWVDRIFEECQS